jgi:hypothetical protein
MWLTSQVPWGAITWHLVGLTTAQNVHGWCSQMGASSTWA